MSNQRIRASMRLPSGQWEKKGAKGLNSLTQRRNKCFSPTMASAAYAAGVRYTISVSFLREADALDTEGTSGRRIWSQSLARTAQEARLEQLEDMLLAGKASYWEDAEALREYIAQTGLSQSACARKFGRSQAGVANRLRLLRLAPEVRQRLRTSGLSERHARALLRLESEEEQHAALDQICAQSMNVAQTEEFVEKRLRVNALPDPADTFDALLQELERLRESMPDIEYHLRETEEMILFTIQIPKKYDKNE